MSVGVQGADVDDHANLFGLIVVVPGRSEGAAAALG
jgi:hypothetical protein